jgi:hypothetical protein
MSKRRTSRRVGALRLVTLAASFAIVAAVARYGVAQQEERLTPSLHAPTADDEPAVGNAADYEVLRKLLGVSEPAKPAAPQAVETAEPGPVEALSVDPVPAQAPAARPQPVAKRVAPAKKAVARTPPRPKPAVASKKSPDAATPAASTDAAPAVPAAAASESVTLASIAPSSIPFSRDTELPPAGAVLRGADYKRWEHLLGPSVQWALLRGAHVRVGEHKPIREEAARAAATQRYSAQVELTSDRRDMKNFVAGIPFPLVTKEDPDAGVKIILNQQSRLIVDDVDARKMGCHLGEITPAGMKLERTFQVEHWRRLFYVGRLYHQPAPTWENQEKIRYRELQYPAGTTSVISTSAARTTAGSTIRSHGACGASARRSARRASSARTWTSTASPVTRATPRGCSGASSVRRRCSRRCTPSTRR